jgi:hypothetical protein
MLSQIKILKYNISAKATLYGGETLVLKKDHFSNEIKTLEINVSDSMCETDRPLGQR